MIASVVIIFVSQFFWVLLLGFQQTNVHQGRKLRAFVTSFALGLCQLAMIWFIPRASRLCEFSAFLLAGPLAITLAMVLYPPQHTYANKHKQKARQD